ncbi:hypothetical protein [Nocardia transvalensis]|uniref:hypothetical protein n=1 Tax=Nocardia transvalensis TaxID=37333 RepID=UPI00189519D9|nr:hypothetical protein [Nocardia transvalensis]MBF6327485.1 hypothetical protein [Nocardia transvalensis]
MRSGEASVTGVDKILDSGRDGLRFFTTFVPRYRDWTGTNPQGKDENSLTARYDQQRGMNVDPLRAFATLLRQQLSGTVGDQIGIQQARFAELPARWSDSEGANSAVQHAQTVSGQVAADRDALGGVAQAVTTAADKLEEVVRTKADAVRTDLSTKNAAGKSGEQVDKIIAYARGNFGAAADADAQTQLVQQVLPEFTSGDPKAYCEQWLNGVFVPTVDSTVQAYTGLTDATHTAVTGIYDQLAGALESVNSAAPYNSPGGTPSATTDLGDNAVPAVTQTLFSGGKPTDGTEPAATSPAAVTPAAADVPVATQVSASMPTDTNPQQPATTNASFIAGNTDPSKTGTDPSKTGTVPSKTGTDPSKTGTDPSKTATDPSKTVIPETPKMPTTTGDMGKEGVWRPGDIANVITATSQITGKVPDILTHLGDPLKAVGSTAESFGNAFKSVIGTDGITGLMKEGIDVVERIDKMIDHHVNPTDASTGASGHPPSGQPGDNGQSHGNGQGQQQPGQQQPGPQQPGNNPQAQPPTSNAQTQHQTGGTETGRPPQPGTSQPPTAQASYASADSAALSTAAPATPTAATQPSGFFGSPAMASASRTDDETDHRSKVQYAPPIIDSPPQDPETEVKQP